MPIGFRSSLGQALEKAGYLTKDQCNSQPLRDECDPNPPTTICVSVRQSSMIGTRTNRFSNFTRALLAMRHSGFTFSLRHRSNGFSARQSKGGQGDETPLKLGTVGARIVAETLIGLWWGDGHSYLRQAPNWVPRKEIRSMGDLIDFALS